MTNRRIRRRWPRGTINPERARLALATPVILYAMLSGFLLRADPASSQAAHILRTLLNLVPLGGSGFWSSLLLGPEPSLMII